jgi:hypothetical protein
MVPFVSDHLCHVANFCHARLTLQPEMLEHLISPLEAHEISADNVETYFIIS